jgi:hypothetical protein
MQQLVKSMCVTTTIGWSLHQVLQAQQALLAQSAQLVLQEQQAQV